MKGGIYRLCDLTVNHIKSESKAKAMYSEIVKMLRANGWKVRGSKRGDSGYISDRWDYAYSNHLQIRIQKSIMSDRLRMNSHFEFEIFQELTKPDHPSGGVYVNDRFEKMPYILKVRTRLTLYKIAMIFKNHGVDINPEDSRVFPKLATAKDSIIRNHERSFDKKPYDFNADYKPKVNYYRGESKDKKEIVHGSQVWFYDRKGRLNKGIAYYNNGSMWWVVTGKFDYDNLSHHSILINKPEKIRKKENKRISNESLQRELSSAIERMDYLRAHTLKQIIFKDVMYRIWSTKHGGGWWCVNGCGYTDNKTRAGLFNRDEAERLCKNDNELTMSEA